jgi:hypothetical protein
MSEANMPAKATAPAGNEPNRKSEERLPVRMTSALSAGGVFAAKFSPANPCVDPRFQGPLPKKSGVTESSIITSATGIPGPPAESNVKLLCPPPLRMSPMLESPCTPQKT